jgi:hypothetical protein
MNDSDALTYQPVIQIQALEQRFRGPAVLARYRVRRIVRRLNAVPVANLRRRVA